MKLLVQSAIIFFGTLMAAGLVALGEPGRSAHNTARESAAQPPVEMNSAAGLGR